MRDWKLPGRSQQQQQQQHDRFTTSNNSSVNGSSTSSNHTIRSHGVNLAVISRYQYNKSEDRVRQEALTSSTSLHHMPASCGVGNRSRADSGTSTHSSSSCDGAETPLLGGIQQPKKSRKRSHRPRGCRGGSSRRGANRKAMNGQIQQPQYDSEGMFVSHGSNHLSSSLGDDVPLENMYPYQGYHPRQDPRLSKSALLPCRPQQQHHLSVAPKIDSFDSQAPLRGAELCKRGIPIGQPTEPNLSVSFPEGNDVNYFHAVFKHASDDSKMQADYDASELNPFANSFEIFPPTSKEGSLPYSDSISASLSSSSSASEYILPPLPADALGEEKPTILDGPNPYALQSCTGTQAASTRMTETMHRNEIDNVPSRPLQDQNGQWNHPLNPTEKLLNSANTASVFVEDRCIISSDSLAFSQRAKANVAPIEIDQHVENHLAVPLGTTYNDCDMNNNTAVTPSENIAGGDNSYRCERIERQRQMMAQGGSLFVTSPRSFLMGWRKTAPAPAT